MNINKARAGTSLLRERVQDSLRELITSGHILPGDKLPTEPALVEKYGVSRTVIREAVASLRAEKLVESRHGSGVFVLKSRNEAALALPIRAIKKISEMLEELELRVAVEIEAAILACQRGSPAQIAAIVECCNAFEDLAHQGKPTTDADFEFHMAIAKATNNPRFEAFLQALGRHTIPRENLKGILGERLAMPNRDRSLGSEHRAIADAIMRRDPNAARSAIRNHLDESAERYRQMSK